jgi:hypothetical protein
VRIGVPARVAVTHTIVRVRQEPHDPKKATEPYGPAMAYREFVYFSGRLRWAFETARMKEATADLLVTLAPHVHYIGKRGSFVQIPGDEPPG